MRPPSCYCIRVPHRILAKSAANSMSEPRLFGKQNTSLFRQKLLNWYETNKRDLPWRKSRDPYHIWLSEIMLQQTRVAAVIEHYRQFLGRFPTIEKLAAARESSVLAVWSGLGYYRRARMLRAAAKVIVCEYAGKFPATAGELRALPGIGRYTAAAIASIAFGEAVAVVDGNVERVLRRFFGEVLVGEQCWQRANQLLDPQRSGDFNQAIMELGATVCTPRAPVCLTCPIVDLCATRGDLTTSEKSPPQQKRDIHYSLLCKGLDGSGQIFLVQRPRNSSLMAGMWELPEIPAGKGTEPTFTLRHSITVTDYTVHVWRDLQPSHLAGKWFRTSRLEALPLTGLSRKILHKAQIL
jgi:A/G-specific adenine glycosylase